MRGRPGRAMAVGLVAVAALGVAAIAAVAVLLAGDEDGLPEAVLRLPSRGDARAHELPDGTPVFVVRLSSGDVSVLEARSPHLDAPIGWCARARTFEDPRYGSRFDLRGRWHAGPAPSGLATYEVLAVEGRHVRVGARIPGAPRGARPSPPAGRLCTEEPHLLAFHDELVVEAGD